MKLSATKRAPRRALGVHTSGRFDRPEERLRASVRRLRRLKRGRRRRVAYVTGTEASGRSGRDMRTVLASDAGWDFAWHAGRGSGECWATWDTSMLERDGESFTVKLTTMTWRRSAEYGGGEAPPVEALVVPLRVVGRPNRRRLYLVVLHASLDNTELRAAIWIDSARGLRRLVVDRIRTEDPHAEVAIEADWNKNYREPAERADVQRHVAKPLRLVQGWDGSAPARGGSHGRQLIDGVVSSRRLLGWSTPWCWLAPDDGSSDHRPVVHTLRWPLLPKRIRAVVHAVTTTKEK